jgi:small Trp-rich protein
MPLLWIGVMLVILRLLEIGPFATLSWWWVLAPLAVAIVWFEWLERVFGRDKRQVEAVQWEARAVAMSCDGALAVSQGRYRDPEGKVGNFITVWERQSDGDYRYIFDAGGDDVPQPPPRKPVEEGNIVVTAIDAVQGLVASCPRGGAAIPPPPAIAVGEEGKADARLSRDGSLRWRWEHRGDSTRYAAVDYFYQGRWLTAFEQSLVPTGD